MPPMNLLLLCPEQRTATDQWTLGAGQRRHIVDILGLTPGQRLRAGVLDGDIGEAEIIAIDANSVRVRFEPLRAPPAPLPLTLIVALPRPKMLKRMLIDATSLGIKRLVLLNSWKVDKSYWQTPNLKAELLREKMLLGLEQAQDTVLPQLILAPRFKPFVEDQLEQICGNSLRLLAHPGAHPPMPMDLHHAVTLAIGPEGGWTDYETDALVQHGFALHSFGTRILRVETALPALVGRVMGLP